MFLCHSMQQYCLWEFLSLEIPRATFLATAKGCLFGPSALTSNIGWCLWHHILFGPPKMGLNNLGLFIFRPRHLRWSVASIRGPCVFPSVFCPSVKKSHTLGGLSPAWPSDRRQSNFFRKSFVFGKSFGIFSENHLYFRKSFLFLKILHFSENL